MLQEQNIPISLWSWHKQCFSSLSFKHINSVSLVLCSSVRSFCYCLVKGKHCYQKMKLKLWVRYDVIVLFLYVSESRLDKQQMGCLLWLKIEIMGCLFSTQIIFFLILQMALRWTWQSWLSCFYYGNTFLLLKHRF